MGISLCLRVLGSVIQKSSRSSLNNSPMNPSRSALCDLAGHVLSWMPGVRVHSSFCLHPACEIRMCCTTHQTPSWLLSAVNYFTWNQLRSPPWWGLSVTRVSELTETPFSPYTRVEHMDLSDHTHCPGPQISHFLFKFKFLKGEQGRSVEETPVFFFFPRQNHCTHRKPQGITIKHKNIFYSCQFRNR